MTRTGTSRTASPWLTRSGGPIWRSPAWPTGPSWGAGGRSRWERSAAGRRSSWPNGMAGPMSRSPASPTWLSAWRWSPRDGSRKPSRRSAGPSASSWPRSSPAAGMRLHYGRGMLEFVSGRHDAALHAFRAAERLAGSLRTPHTLARRLRSHLLQALVRTGNAARRATPRGHGQAGAGAGRDTHRRGIAADRPRRPGGGDHRARTRHRRLGPAGERPSVGRPGVPAPGDRLRRARRPGRRPACPRAGPGPRRARRAAVPLPVRPGARAARPSSPAGHRARRPDCRDPERARREHARLTAGRIAAPA